MDLINEVPELITDEVEEIEDYSNEILELERFFSGITPPPVPIRLNVCTVITDYKLFIESHFITAKQYNRKRYYSPCLHRLKELKQILN